MLELKTNIIFETLTELQEAVNLGLQSKNNWLRGHYEFPMIQNMADNSYHHHISQLWGDDACISKDIRDWLVNVHTWKEVRNSYTQAHVKELTVKEISKLLGYAVKVVAN